ncbi:MAG: radical SAM protein [Treponema sp.]|jgi:putative pyruvate formate lyase activating enzyme|nr:radical SAM protein [Treponema sp.]
MADIFSLYQNCLCCPRACGVNRDAGERGFCGETAELRLSSAVLHRGEEPPLTGKGGSGAVFITGCNLGCAFCQNYQISRGAREPLVRRSLRGKKSSGDDFEGDECVKRGKRPGRTVSAEEFARICLTLRDRGAENINIVTGSHAVPAIAAGISAARNAGLELPVLWNSSGYESLSALAMLKDHVDMYLPDLKTLDSGLAAKWLNAPDYPETARAAIRAMIAARAGKVIVRHLILPGCLDSTRTVLCWFAEHAAGRALLSVMTQYTPIPQNNKRADGPPGRFLNEAEYETVLGWLEEFGIEDGFCQELTAGSDWLPDFNRPNPFSSALSVPVWHWKG